MKQAVNSSRLGYLWYCTAQLQLHTVPDQGTWTPRRQVGRQAPWAMSISEDPTQIELCKLHAMNSTRRGRIHALPQPIHSHSSVQSCKKRRRTGLIWGRATILCSGQSARTVLLVTLACFLVTVIRHPRQGPPRTRPRLISKLLPSCKAVWPSPAAPHFPLSTFHFLASGATPTTEAADLQALPAGRPCVPWDPAPNEKVCPHLASFITIPPPRRDQAAAVQSCGQTARGDPDR